MRSQEDYRIDLSEPVSIGSGGQAQSKQGFDLTKFEVNWEQQIATCPQGKVSKGWKDGRDSYGNPIIHVSFSSRDCSACPVRSQCTRSKLQHVVTAAVNVVRAIDWLDDVPLAKARQSHFARLAPAKSGSGSSNAWISH